MLIKAKERKTSLEEGVASLAACIETRAACVCMYMCVCFATLYTILSRPTLD